MEKIPSDPTEQVLNLTLEIILLLTGEEYFVVKKPRGRPTDKSLQVVEETWKAQTGVHIPLPQSVIHEPNNKQKILELTNKVIELLTGEVPIRCQDVAVYFSMEEWEYIEGHKDRYEDVLMDDDHRPPTSPGFLMCSSSEDPPEQNKEERNEENVTIPNISTPTDHIQENPPPIKEEPVSRDGRNLIEPTQQYPFIHIKEEPASCDGEALTDPNHYAGQYPSTSIKEEPSSCDGEKVKDHKKPPLDLTGQYPHLKTQQDGETVENPVYVIEDHTPHCPSPPVHEEVFPCGGGSLVDDARSLSTPSEDLPDTNPPETPSTTNYINLQFSCSECKKCFLSMAELVSHQGIHVAEKLLQSRTHIVTTTIVHVPQVAPVKHKLLTCSKCGRTFYTKSSLVGHMKTHWGKVSETFQCILCGRFFSTRSLLNLHSKRHFADRPFPCSTCGERFMRTSDLGRHQIKHR